MLLDYGALTFPKTIEQQIAFISEWLDVWKEGSCEGMIMDRLRYNIKMKIQENDFDVINGGN